MASLDDHLPASFALTAREFDQVRRLAYEQFGLELRAGKEQLVSARLAKLMRTQKFTFFKEFFVHLSNDRSGASLSALIDALSTNHTSFFREPAHFEFLVKTVLPELAGRPTFSIWSAACSSGEEPYSIAFTLLQELGPGRTPNFRILATDISTRALAVATKACYPADRFAGDMAQRLRPFLLRGENQARGWYQVKQSVRSLIDFHRRNLMEPISALGPFPVIFCRNVLIYFDRTTQARLVQRLINCLEPGGYLLIGHAESLNRFDHGLVYIQPAIYRKPHAQATQREHALK